MQTLLIVLLLPEITLHQEILDYDNEIFCPDNYNFSNDKCFIVSTTSTCPYKPTLSFHDYEDIALDFCQSGCMLDIVKNTQLGFWQWDEIFFNFGRLFTETALGDDDYISVVANSTAHSLTYETVASSTASPQICAYDSFPTTSASSYCSAFYKICSKSFTDEEIINCHCFNPTNRHFCELDCDNTTTYNATTCASCISLFSSYQEPNVALALNYHDNFIFVSLSSHLKLLNLGENFGNLGVYCFTDAEHDPHDISFRFNKYKDYDNKTYSDSYYVLYPLTGTVGHYWCEGFHVATLKPVGGESTRIIAQAPDADESFTMNITIDYNVTRPLTIHETLQSEIEAVVNTTNITQVKFLNIYPIDYESNTIKLSYRLYFDETAVSMEDVLTMTPTLLPDHHVTVSSSYCLPSETSNGMHLTWKKTLLGMTTTPDQLCLTARRKPVTRTCLGEYLYGTWWSQVSGYCEENSAELYGTAHTLSLYQLVNQVSSGDNLNVSDVVRNLTRHAADPPHISLDVYFMSLVFEKITGRTQRFSSDLLESVIEAASSILDVERDVLEEAQALLNATDMLLYNLDNVLSRIDSDFVQVKTGNIFLQVSVINATTRVGGAALYRDGGAARLATVDSEADIGTVDLDNLQVAAFITNSQLDRIRKSKRVNKLVVTFFPSNALFNPGTSLSKSVAGIYVSGFEEPFMVADARVLLRPDRKYRAELRCQKWEYGRDGLWYNRKGRWVKDKSAAQKLDDVYYCSQKSMFHFGIIAGLEETVALSVLAAIGCALSTTGSVAVVVTGVVYKSWRDNSGTKVLLNFVLTNIFQNVVLAISSGVDSYTDETSCLIVGALLHYSVGSQFSWMTVIGYLQYQRYVQVYYVVHTKFLLLASVVSWLLPTIPVMVVLTIKRDAYEQEDFCYLQDEFLYYAVFAPVSLTLAVNTGIFVTIMMSICGKNAVSQRRDNISWLNIRLAILLFFIMGLYWLLGITARFAHIIALDYFFCISASFQGVVVFLYFIVFNKMTRNFWMRQLKRSEAIATMQIWLQQRRRLGRIEIDKGVTRRLKVKLARALTTKRNVEKLK